MSSRPQERRDTLDRFYQDYREPKPASRKFLNDHEKRLSSILNQIWNIFNGHSLKAAHFSSSGGEHDLYALVGAIDKRGVLTAPQLREHSQDVAGVISEFLRQVTLFVADTRANLEIPEHAYPRIVEEYGATFLGGQVNNAARRQARIAIWVEVLNDTLKTVDSEGFSPFQRDLIWARSANKRCGRCGKVVAYEDYQAGHIVPRSLGGPSVVSNGRVEHKRGNQTAGAGDGGTCDPPSRPRPSGRARSRTQMSRGT